MQRVFAIGDIHGCCKTFIKLLETIQLRHSDIVYCLGDYIDRGPDSKGVIDHILHLRNSGYTIHTLRGNHEQIMLDSGNSDDAFDQWMNNGGGETLDSFRAESLDELGKEYLDFLEGTEYYLLYDKFIFVHAGLDFRFDDPLSELDAMLWIRYQPVDLEWLGERILVHGHTPVTASEVRSQKGSQVINLDGGCVYKKPGQGQLFALETGTMEFFSVANVDWPQ